MLVWDRVKVGKVHSPYETRCAAAMMRLTFERPYLATALCSMQRIAVPGLGTMAVDRRWRVFIDPAIVQKWTVTEMSGVFYHEVSHLLREHADRARIADDSVLWNVAADAEINDDLAGENVDLPGHPVYPHTIGEPEGRLAEEYYHHLIESPPVANTPDGVIETMRGPSPRKDSCFGELNCGSAATGVAEAWETDIAAQFASDRPGLSEAEILTVRASVAVSIKEHAVTRGTVPGHWKRWATDRLEPRVDWRRELGSSVRVAIADARGAVDYSYRRPSRRQSSFPNLILPSLRGPTPSVAVVVDTSGSVSNAMLDRAIAEVAAILRAVGQSEGVWVLAVDSVVHSCRRVFRPNQVELLGGGGTDLCVGMSAIEKLRPRPSVAIFITDGQTPWPVDPPSSTRVVIALTNVNSNTPPWAKSIVISDQFVH